MTDFFLRDVSDEACTPTADDRDLSATQGTDTSPVSSPNVTVEAFPNEVMTWNITVGAAGVDGEYTVLVDLAAVSSDTEVRWRLQRLNSSCVLQDSSGYSSVYTAAGAQSDALTLDTSGAWAAGDVLRLSIEIRRVPTGHGNKAIDVNVSDADSQVQEPAAAELGADEIMAALQPSWELAQRAPADAVPY